MNLQINRNFSSSFSIRGQQCHSLRFVFRRPSVFPHVGESLAWPSSGMSRVSPPSAAAGDSAAQQGWQHPGGWGMKAEEVVVLTLQLKHRPSYGVLASLLARIRPNAKLSRRKKLPGHGGPSGSSARALFHRQVFMEESQASLALGPRQPLSCPESILHPTPFLQRIDK